MSYCSCCLIIETPIPGIITVIMRFGYSSLESALSIIDIRYDGTDGDLSIQVTSSVSSVS